MLQWYKYIIQLRFQAINYTYFQLNHTSIVHSDITDYNFSNPGISKITQTTTTYTRSKRNITIIIGVAYVAGCVEATQALRSWCKHARLNYNKA